MIFFLFLFLPDDTWILFFHLALIFLLSLFLSLVLSHIFFCIKSMIFDFTTFLGRCRTFFYFLFQLKIGKIIISNDILLFGFFL